MSEYLLNDACLHRLLGFDIFVITSLIAIGLALQTNF